MEWVTGLILQPFGCTFDTIGVQSSHTQFGFEFVAGLRAHDGLRSDPHRPAPGKRLLPLTGGVYFWRLIMDEAVDLLFLCQEAGVNSREVLRHLHESVRLVSVVSIPQFDPTKEPEELEEAMTALTLLRFLVKQFEKEWDKLPSKEDGQ